MSAISAQGTLIKIETGSGGALNASAIALGNPTIITSAAHGLLAGDRVTAAAFTGADAASINSLTFTVVYKTTNTVAINLDSTGLTITVGSGTLTPVTLTTVGKTKSFNGFDGAASELDTTNFASTAKEFMLGLVDNGSLSMDLQYDKSDAGQVAVEASRVAGTAKTWKVVLPSGTTPTATFTAYVKSFSKTGAVDAVVMGTVNLRISGAVTWA